MPSPKLRAEVTRRNDSIHDDVPTEATRLLDAAVVSSTDITESNCGWDGYHGFEGRSWWLRPSIHWVLVPWTLFIMALGGMVVPRLNLILDLICTQYFAEKARANPHFEYDPVVVGHDNPQCKIPEVTSKLSVFLLALNFITGVLSVIVVPQFGKLSDRYGRCRLLALASLGGVLNELITIIAGSFPNAVDYRLLILGAVFDGITGSFNAAYTLVLTYTSDSTPPSKRAVSMGYIMAGFYGGLACGPILGAYLIKLTGSFLSIFYLTTGCNIFFLIFMAFVVPESLSEKKMQIARETRERDKATRPNSFRSFKVINLFTPLGILWPSGPGTSHKLRLNLVALAISDSVAISTSVAAGQVALIYSEQMFQWGTLETSRYVSAISATRVAVLMGLLPTINYFGRVLPRRRMETSTVYVDKISGADSLDIWTMRFAFTVEIIGCVVLLFARSAALFFTCGIAMSFGSLGPSTVQAMVSKHVPQELTGQLMGAFGMLQAILRVVGPVMFNGVFAATSKTFPQAFYVLLLGFYALGFVASFIIRPNVHWGKDDPRPGQTEPNAADPGTSS